MYVMSGKFHNLVKPFQSIHISCSDEPFVNNTVNTAMKENLAHACRQKTFQCNICDFFNDTSLNKHMMIHIGVELYFCYFLKSHLQ